MYLEDRALCFMEPRQNPNVLSGLDATEASGKRWLDVQSYIGRALISLRWGTGTLLKNRTYIADRGNLDGLRNIHNRAASDANAQEFPSYSYANQQVTATLAPSGCLLTHRIYLFYLVVKMPLEPSLGEFEQIVLLAILRVRSAYGVTIRSEIEARTGRAPSPGALYTTLDRLEDKGLVTSRMGEPTPQRGGRAKRYFEITTAGIEAVSRAQRSYQSLLEGLQLPGVAHA